MGASQQSGSTWISRQTSSTTCRINLPPQCRDEAWAKERGYIQERMTSTPNLEHLQFNFLTCEWIDPLPLMFIVLEVAHARSLGIKVKILLPDENFTENSGRLLKFIAEEGFLKCLDVLREKYREIDILDKKGKKWEENPHDQTAAAYKDAHCLPMTFFDFSQKIKVAEKIGEVLPQVDIKLGDKVSPYEREWLIYKLRLLLQETLCNIGEHAYKENEQIKPAIIYVRYRIGYVGMVNASEKEEFDKHINQESHHCPKLSKNWLEGHQGCLEVFVLDRGQGMLKSLGVTDPNVNFGTIMKEAFLKGKSRKKTRTTPITGLQLLHDLLRDSADFIRGHEENIWFGCHAPIERVTESVSRPYSEIEKTGTGLALHFRLSWRTDTSDNKKWGKFEETSNGIGGNGINDFWKELSRSTEECKSSIEWFKKQAVLDERFTPEHSFSSSSPLETSPTKWLLWLVPPNRMKNDIQSKLREYVKKYKYTQKGEKTILVIADIPYYEARTYEAALDRYEERLTDIEDAEWLMQLKNVILCTNRWRFSGLFYEEIKDSDATETSGMVRHGFSNLKKNITELEIPAPLQDSDNFNLMLWIARWLKWHDSRRLWEAVRKQGDKTFIPRKVIWDYQRGTENHKYINGYLDFARTVRNPLCLDIYRNALARIWGILPSVRMENLDLLTMTVLKDIQAEGVYGGAQNGNEKHRLKIGSVLVSGVTWDAEEEPGIRVLHFFMHENTEGYPEKNSPEKSGATLLFWTPGEGIKNDDPSPPPRRIGKTAFIAPLGWKSFEIPRFDKSGKVVGHRKPSETYDDWQVSYPSIVKMGHWVYQEHHDFLTINIRDVIKTAFVEPKPDELAGFLADNILVHLGMKKGDLIEKYQPLIGENKSKKSPGVLVYRSHPNTDFIIRKLLEMLVEEEGKLLRTKANQRIFPILPVRVRWGGSTLLMPPLMREEIRNVLKEDPSTPILIFDDAIISGRTLYSLHSILTSLIQDITEDNNKKSEHVFDMPTLEIEKSALASLVEIAKRIPEEDTKPANMFDNRATISGNSLRDLQRIINTTIQKNSPSGAKRSIGETPVSMMVIVNRMRLPTDIIDPQLKYYWRQDVPSLGKDGSCPLCHAINMAEKFKGSLASKASQKTLEKWIDPWKACSPIENWNLGLPPKPLSKIQEKRFCYRQDEPLDTIKLTYTTGLAIHASELHSMTGDDEYFLRHVSDSDSSSEIQIELVASQLFLFADEFDVKTKIKGVQSLLKALIGLKDCDKDIMHAGLAILATMRGTVSLDIEQQRKIIEDINGDDLEKLPDIFLAWMVKESLLGQDDKRHEESYKKGRNILRSKATLLNCLFEELFSYNGNSHSRPIPILYDKLKGKEEKPAPEEIKPEEIKNALSSLEEVEWLNEEIKTFHLDRKFNSASEEKWQQLQNGARAILESNPFDEQKARVILKEYLLVAEKDILRKYFFPVKGKGQTSKFREEIQNIITKAEENKEESIGITKETKEDLNFRNDAFSVWVTWYDGVYQAIKNAITNVKHCKNAKKILNPWLEETATDNDTKKMWVKIHFGEESVILYFANSSDSVPRNYANQARSAAEILNDLIHTKGHGYYLPVMEIGGNVSVEEIRNGVLAVKITIPYATYLVPQENTK
jgi:hypothetical protein